MNKQSDCNGIPQKIGQNTVYIFGRSSDVMQGSGVLACTITLNTENVREPNIFKIQYLAVDIREETTHFYVYDGEFNGRMLVCVFFPLYVLVSIQSILVIWTSNISSNRLSRRENLILVLT